MGIFRKHDIDLSDEALNQTAEDSNEIANGSATEAAEASAQQNPESDAQDDSEETAEQAEHNPLDQEAQAERESQWQQAREQIADLWPEAMGEGEKLISRMVEIGERYGDPQLWQRSPQGIMREAAIELFGLPKERDNGYARIAAEAAREAAMQEMSLRDQAKTGLAKTKSRQAPPPPLTEEEKIINAIAKARRGSIF